MFRVLKQLCTTAPMRAASSPRQVDHRWRIGHSTSSTTTASEQLEAFLKARLDHWDVEAAEVICTWGRVGDMCSPDYQSQLRKAQATLQEVQKGKERQHESAATQARQDARAAARRRHRDRLAAEAYSRAEAKRKAALRQQQREEQRGVKEANTQKRSTHMDGALSVRPQPGVRIGPAVSASQPFAIPAEQAAQKNEMQRTHTESVRVYHQQPAPPSVARSSAVQAARMPEAAGLALTFLQSPRMQSAVAVAPHAADHHSSSSDSSSLALGSDDDDHASNNSRHGATTHSPLGESFSGTFVVRRMLTAHVYSTQAMRRGIIHHNPAQMRGPPAARVPSHPPASPPPREVPQSLLPPPCRRRSSSKATVTATGTADSSLLPVDPSLPYAADEVTAIFPSRSQSHEKVSPMGRSDDGTHPTNATTEFISPIRDAHTIDELSSLSSAGSYLRGGDGEKSEMTP